LALIGPRQTHNHIKSRGFPRSVGAQQTDNFTLPHFDTDSVDYAPVFIGFDQLVGFQALHSFQGDGQGL
jgi:hypothetical protein